MRKRKKNKATLKDVPKATQAFYQSTKVESSVIIEEPKKFLTKEETINILKTMKDIQRKLQSAINIDERRIGNVDIPKQ